MYIENKEDKVFIPQTKNTITASDYNQIKNEIQNAIELAGMAPEKDVIQFPQAVKKLTEQSGAEEMEKIEAAGTVQVEVMKAAAEEQVARAKYYAQSCIGKCLGEVYSSQSSLASDNPGALPVWTGEYYVNASILYPDFYTFVKAHPELCKTRAGYDAALDQYGECPFYVIDEVDGSLRLPKLVNFIKSAGADGITQKEAGLPNITGDSRAPDHGGITPAKGCFARSTDVAEVLTGNGGRYTFDTFDASRSSAIYGKSNTVTPAHTTLYPWVYAYNAAVPASTAQAAEFTGALSGKADADLSNTVPSSAFKNESTNWNGYDLTAGLSVPNNTDWVAPKNGLLVCLYTFSSTFWYGTVDGVRLVGGGSTAILAGGNWIPSNADVGVGQVIHIVPTTAVVQASFYPKKGAI